MTGSDAIRLKLRVKGHRPPPTTDTADGTPQHSLQHEASAAHGDADASIEGLDEAAQAHAAAATLSELSVQDAETAVAAALTVTPLGGSSKGN